MFKKIKKIGIYCALFMALFSLKNDAANCASFNCNARQYSYNRVRGNRWDEWNTGGQLLDAAILKAHLNNQGNNALKELARLILAQGGYQRGGNIRNHNIQNNNNIDYIIPPQLQLQKLLEQQQQLQLLRLLQQLLQQQPQQPQQPLNQMMADLTDTYTVQYVRGHIFHRHTGRILGKGYFNVNVNFIMNNVDHIIKALFSENITFLSCGEIRRVANGTEQFAVDVVYNGPNIPRLNPNQSIGIDVFNTRQGYQQQLTNNVRIIVGVKDGRISLVSIYPVG